MGTQGARVICSGGVWTNLDACPINQNCASADGSCQPIIPQCADAGSGTTYCGNGSPGGYEDEYTVYACGPDQLTATDAGACTGTCADGHCVQAKCGDGRVEQGEQCDDGNTVPLDGCEPNCKNSGVVDIKAANNNTCALLVGGYVICWGDNSANQLGLGHQKSETNFPPYALTNSAGGPAGPINLGGAAMAITMGDTHVCALMQDNSVQCWGDNTSGQLGRGNASTVEYATATPNNIGRALDGGVTAIAAGGGTTCAVLTSGSVTCWGDNSSGQVGIGTTATPLPNPGSSQLVNLGGAAAIGVAVGEDTVCANLNTNSIKCWGYNGDGELGIAGSASSVNVPSSSVPLSFTPLSVSVADEHACALSSSNYVQCWGYNGDGELGIGSKTNIGTPTNPIASNGSVVLPGAPPGTALAVVAGGTHTCALVNNTTTVSGMVCWGYNQDGELGNGGTTDVGNGAGPSVSSASAISGTALTRTAWHSGSITRVPCERRQRSLLGRKQLFAAWVEHLVNNPRPSAVVVVRQRFDLRTGGSARSSTFDALTRRRRSSSLLGRLNGQGCRLMGTWNQKALSLLLFGYMSTAVVACARVEVDLRAKTGAEGGTGGAGGGSGGSAGAGGASAPGQPHGERRCGRRRKRWRRQQ